ncbi:selenium-dependent molybdenum cofactor biosynthesis protein YqeB [Clostridiaceae bacterium 35-E11]
MFTDKKVIVKGGGDLATAVAHKLSRAGFPVMITELEKPMMVRRTVSFANCVYEGEWTVEGVTAVLAHDAQEVERIMKEGKIPLVIDPICQIREVIKPTFIVDAILAKSNCGTKLHHAPIVIGLGPGFTAGEDVHAVIETNRGHHLGRIILQGTAQPNTGVPGNIAGFTNERVFRAPCEGIVRNYVEIGTAVEVGQLLCSVDEREVKAKIRGMVRGLIYDGLRVKENEKLGDIDPRRKREHCHTISDKGRNVAGGALEAMLYLLQNKVHDGGKGVHGVEVSVQNMVRKR